MEPGGYGPPERWCVMRRVELMRFEVRLEVALNEYCRMTQEDTNEFTRVVLNDIGLRYQLAARAKEWLETREATDKAMVKCELVKSDGQV